MILGILVFATTLAKLSSWFFSTEGLVFIFIASSAIAYFRWTIVTRQITPEIKGTLKRIHPDDIQRMKPWLFKNIVGQGASFHSVMQIIKRNLGMVESGRHLGSFLLIGPTGTGKSFFAKLLAEGLYGRGSLLMVAMNQDGLRGEKVIEKPEAYPDGSPRPSVREYFGPVLFGSQRLLKSPRLKSRWRAS